MVATVAFVSAYLAWQHHTLPGARSLVVLFGAVGWWALCDALSALSPTIALAELFEAKLRFFSVSATGPLLLLVVLEYSEHTEWLKPVRFAPLFVIPVVIQLIIWFGPAGAFFKSITYTHVGDLWLPDERTFGPWFYLHLAHNYLVIFAGTSILLSKIYRARYIHRTHALLILTGVIILIGVSLGRTYSTGDWLRIDWIMIGVMVPMLIWPYSLLQYYLLDLAPIARSLLIEQMNDLVIVLDAQNQIIDFNPAAQQVFGWEHRGILGQPVHESGQWSNSLIDLTHLTEDTHSELVISDRVYDLRVSPLFHYQSQPAGNLIVLRDITDHKAIQHDLATNESQLTGLLSALPDIVIHLDRAGTYLNIHGDPDARLRVTTRPRTDYIGKTTIFDVLPKAEAAQIHAAINRALDTGAIQTVEYELQTVSGRLQFEARCAPISANEVILLARDVTQRVTMENALREREAETRAFQQCLVALHRVTMKLAQISDLTTLYRHTIELACAELGFDRIGLFLVDEADPTMMRGAMGIDPQGQVRDETATYLPIESNVKLNEALETKARYKLWDDDTLWDNQQPIGRGWNAMALLWNGAESIGWLVADNLITQRPLRPYEMELMALYGTTLGYLITKLRSELALRQSEARYRTVVETSPDAIVIITDGKLTYVSPRMIQMFKADRPEQVIGTPVEQWITPDDHERVRANIQRIMAGNPTVTNEYTMLTASGGTFVGESRASPLYDAEGHATALISIVRDVTDRYLMDEALRDSEARYRTLVEMFPDAVATTDLQGVIAYVSPRTIEIFGGNDANDFIGTRVIDWIMPIEQARVRENMGRLLQGEPGIDNRYAMHTLSGGEFTGEVRSNLLVDATGQPTAILAVIRDVTEQVRAEERRVELEMEKERTKVFQQFISHASHDLKTPLTNIKMHLYLMDKVATPEQQVRYRRVLDEQVAHLEQLLEDMLSMSRLDKALSFKFERVNLNSLLPIVIARYDALAQSRDQQLELTMPPDLPLVQADPMYIAQALMNILANAVHYTPNGGTITVRSYPQNDSVIIDVVDTGIGINTADLPRIFERFFRADPARGSRKGGAGLGLPIAKRIIEAHGGTIQAESEPAVGSRFQITLPVFRPTSESSPSAE